MDSLRAYVVVAANNLHCCRFYRLTIVLFESHDVGARLFIIAGSKQCIPGCGTVSLSFFAQLCTCVLLGC